MLCVTLWTTPQEHLKEVIARFKETGGAPPKGVKMIGRWHDTNQRRGVVVAHQQQLQRLRHDARLPPQTLQYVRAAS
jgi:hypothetical protein